MIGGTIYDIKDLEFKFVEDTEHDTLAVVERSNPYVVLALLDFKNKKFWPFIAGKQTWQQSESQGQELLSILNKDNNKSRYILSSDVHGNMGRKVH